MIWRSPTTMSASPRTIGSTSLPMSEPWYWLSASVLTITSAPSFSAASTPAWKPEARPLLFVSRTMWSTPFSRATSTVRSVEPSSMTSHSTTSNPGTSRGRSASVTGSVCSSSRQGIWMINFIATGKDGTAPVILFCRMDGSTITRPRPGTAAEPPEAAPAGPGARLAAIAFALLCLGFAIGFFVFPTYPVYDSYYSLLWGRDLMHGTLPVFDGFRYPTEHPLAIAAGAVLSLFGHVGDRMWVALMLASFLALVAGVYRLGPLARTPPIGAVGARPLPTPLDLPVLAAAGLLLTRFDFAFLAARGYIDVSYMALVVWAAVLEWTRPRRGTVVLLLLAAAGLLRPEAWLLAALYWCWLAWPATWPERLRYAAPAAIGPVVWVGLDAVVTGDPLFSLHHTGGLAEDLGRSRPLSQLPAAVPEFFARLLKIPVLVAAALGLVVGVVMSPRRMLMPLLLLGTGLLQFVVIGLAGASVIERYLAVASLAAMVFAAVTLAGWTMLEPGRLRTSWAVASVAAVLLGAGFTAAHLDFSYFTSELRFRGQSHHDLSQVLHSAPVRAALRCGPLTAPNHKVIPDSRWIAGLPDGRAIPRADRSQTPPRRGVALVVTSRFAILKEAWTDPDDDARIQLLPPGFRRVATSRFFAAYARC